MPDKAQQKRRTVFKSLHKALPDLGIERTLSYFVGVSAVGAFKPVQFHSRQYRRLRRRLALGHWVMSARTSFSNANSQFANELREKWKPNKHKGSIAFGCRRFILHEASYRAMMCLGKRNDG